MPRSNIVIYPYKKASESSKRLVRNLESILDQEVLSVLGDGNYVYKAGDLVVGWGSGHKPNFRAPADRYLNNYEAVCNSIDKRVSFKNFVDNKVTIPAYTLSTAEANKWLEQGKVVLSRTEVEGMKGQGIIINHPDITDEVVAAPLYTEFVRRKREIRIHVFNGKVIFGQEKHLKKDTTSIKKMILKDNAEWEFEWLDADGRTDLGNKALNNAVNAIQANGLTFGAVDMLIDDMRRSYVLETNTCPELGKDGAALYAKNIIKMEKTLRG